MIAVNVTLDLSVSDEDLKDTRDFVASLTGSGDIKVSKISNLDPEHERFTYMLGAHGPGGGR